MKRKNCRWMVAAMVAEAFTLWWCAADVVNNGDTGGLVPAAMTSFALLVTFQGWLKAEHEEDVKEDKWAMTQQEW